VSIDKKLVVSISFILLSFILVFAGIDKEVTSYLLSFGSAGAFVAGVFYTLGITTPFAMVVILEIMRASDPAVAAILASFSAAAVDCLLFLMVRDALESSARQLMEKIRKKFEKASAIFPLAGLMVFGMPLPDELGLALMEMTKIELPKLFAVVFIAKLLTLLMLWKALV